MGGRVRIGVKEVASCSQMGAMRVKASRTLKTDDQACGLSSPRWQISVPTRHSIVWVCRTLFLPLQQALYMITIVMQLSTVKIMLQPRREQDYRPLETHHACIIRRKVYEANLYGSCGNDAASTRSA